MKEDPTPLFTEDHPSYETEVKESMRKHPAGKKIGLTPVLQASGAPKPVRNLKRVK